jgi:hypothetical protein
MLDISITGYMTHGHCSARVKFKLVRDTHTHTVTERSKACTVFARSEAGIVGSNPTQDMDVWCVYEFFCVCVVLCLGSGLATGQSLVQGVLPSVK